MSIAAVEQSGRIWRERGLIYGLGAVVSALSLLPLARLLVESVMVRGTPSLDAFGRVLSSPATWTAFRNSMETALGGTAIAFVIGAIVAIVVAMTDIRARSTFVFCFVLPLMIAPQVTALAWLQVTGPASPLLKAIGMAPPLGSRNPLYSGEGIILLLGIQYAPLVFLTLRAGLRSLPRELVEAGLSSGASKWMVLRTIIVPLMTPPLIAGLALSFVSCIGNFGIPAFLGIPGRYTVLPTLIYQRLSGLGPSALSEVAVLSILIGVVAIAGILLQDLMLHRRDFRTTTSSAQFQPFELGRWRLPTEMLLWATITVILLVPLIGLVMTSLVPAYGVRLTTATATLANFRFVLFEHEAARRAFANSFMLAGGAAVLLALISMPLAYFVVWRRTWLLRLLNLAAELPYALPGVVLSIAAILLFLKPIPMLGISLYNTIWIIFFAYLARFLVLGLRPVVSGYHQLDRALEEAAQVAGASLTFRLRTVIVPLVAPAAVAGAILIFLTAFNELTVSALLWSSRAETLGVVVFSFEQGGESNFAAAMSVLTIVVTLAILLLLAALGRHVPAGVLPWRD
ncbi:ABC transporter permease [Alsobacter metallidurans]|uniref:ABC transporter permease n=1 Tax=Alsobacter metallidurans TaxID=340221 RepID=A0A917I634_9HYPH|nr:iron ABC transporter permease [Alsobacter metallidurans]GGH16297.1 ABC transporter permease [Alsobacter metallidurans]